MDPSFQIHNLHWPPTTHFILTGLITLQYPSQLIQHRAYRLFPHSCLLHPVFLYPLPLLKIHAFQELWRKHQAFNSSSRFLSWEQSSPVSFSPVSCSPSQAVAPLVSLFLHNLSLCTVCIWSHWEQHFQVRPSYNPVCHKMIYAQPSQHQELHKPMLYSVRKNTKILWLSSSPKPFTSMYE